jgi:ATP-dependent Lon protease
MNNDKIKAIFTEESVYKIPQNYAVFSGYNLPSFVKDWLIKRYTNDNNELDILNLKQFLTNHIVQKGNKIKGSLINDSDERVLLARIVVEPDVKTGILRFSIPDIEIKNNEGVIPQHIAKKHSDLKGGEVWGVVKIVFVPRDGKQKGKIEIIDFKPFKPYEINIDYYRENRKEFNLHEWIDLLICSMEYNPDGFDSLSQKLLFISRLLAFVESNLNIVELAPKGTGKSYIFGNLSKYGWIVSGGIVSRAKLLYDVAKGTPGIITIYDLVALDEIETIKFTDESELQGALKGYLESGKFTIANYNGVASAGFILLGNIPLTSSKTPIYNNYFKDLPSFFQNSALLDRFHCFIEGWKLPRIKENLKVCGYSLNVEYFSEVLHVLRTIPEFSDITTKLLSIPKNADTRDTKAVVKLCTGYLKLLFPHVKDINDIT